TPGDACRQVQGELAPLQVHSLTPRQQHGCQTCGAAARQRQALAGAERTGKIKQHNIKHHQWQAGP
ncbi:hypothetical protein LXA26_18460, partial [Erwinia amylovora]|uniref:hypothetical protein n=1 Tax=Erwinia amylovora TaxID=552 RepID=UPI0020C033A7